MKVKVINKNLNDLQDNVFRPVGSVFECDKERAEYLLKNNAVKIVEEEKIETINKDNVLEKLDETLEKLENEELVETIPVVDKNGIIVDRVAKDKPTKKKKSSKK